MYLRNGISLPEEEAPDSDDEEDLSEQLPANGKTVVGSRKRQRNKLTN